MRIYILQMNSDSNLTIQVVAGAGTGKTELSSFDSALNNIGVANYNLIPLSSIIPPQSKVVKIDKYQTPESDFGHRLYCVKAEMRSSIPNQYIGAAVGWYQYHDNRGLFVEHETVGNSHAEVEQSLTELIQNSLNDLCDFRKVPFQKQNINYSLAITQVQSQPAAALVIAIYQSESWN
jgi:arginine decarboxylase